uniref:Uncharacterized protein n=1 Tax=Manihot esculenta TaxID=3983 RepID=A0A2C9VHE9_MANES
MTCLQLHADFSSLHEITRLTKVLNMYVVYRHSPWLTRQALIFHGGLQSSFMVQIMQL